MRRDHRPYFLKLLYLRLQKLYVNHFLEPQFDILGDGWAFMNPWHVKIFGPGIEVGRFATFIAASDRKIRLSSWYDLKKQGRIRIGDYCLVSPGVRISSAAEITVGNGSMIAGNAYITDSDWHDIYDRVSTGTARPVKIHENVWIGDSAIVCKGVTIGMNSVIGAGSVVVKDIPDNVVAAGNPAVVVRKLDPSTEIKTRAAMYKNVQLLKKEFDHIDREYLSDNTIFHWLRHVFFPRRGE